MYRYILSVVLLAGSIVSLRAESGLVERLNDTDFIQIEADSFPALTLKQQALTYWLNQCAIALDPIAYDQLSPYGLRQKRILEAVVSNEGKVDSAVYRKILDFTKLFWANKGNHLRSTGLKILPSFTTDELRQALIQAGHAELVTVLDTITLSLFDAKFDRMIAADPSDAESATAGRPRAGTPDGKTTPGRYAEYLKKANEYLEKARAYAEPAQARVIDELIRFHRTGDNSDWVRFASNWASDDEPVDFMSGFIGEFGPRHGISQSLVVVRDQDGYGAAKRIARDAQFFEDHAPFPQQYKRQAVKPPIVNLVKTTILTGAFDITSLGIRLPGEETGQAGAGSKVLLFFDQAPTLIGAVAFAGLPEFSPSKKDAARDKKYLTQQERLMTLLSDVLGYGSVAEIQTGSAAQSNLKEYSSILKEARAETLALWEIFDPKLKQMDVVVSDEIGKAMYDIAALDMLAQLRLIPQGETLASDRQRALQLIIRYVMEKTGAIVLERTDGKSYIRVQDYNRMREGLGTLLAELTRIQAEGDYSAIKALVEDYGLHFDPKLRDEIIARFNSIRLPGTNFAPINPDLRAHFNASGEITKVEIEYPRSYVKQQLSYAAMYP